MMVFVILLIAAAIPLHAQYLPDWFLPLREAVYEQCQTPEEIEKIYREITGKIMQIYSGDTQKVMLSRCEYLMGRAYQDNKRDEEARPHYQKGIKLAEEVTKTAPGAQAWLVLAENLSQACSLGPWPYTIANGLNVEKFSKNALSYDSRCAAAKYLIAARWVFAPAPFNNIKKGIEMMQDIFNTCDMGKDDIFDVNSAVGYAYIQQKKYADARPWLIKALDIYPANKYAGEMLKKTEK
ncbi:MAG: tetratricopeptide repeat protein [Treponema sp.]|jgi:tetratricopeptide (TPR) repeat protein|nr:tetratricopeptide repeat protein [Treponema sp.]